MKREWLRAGLIFGGGDLVACLITGTWALWRWLKALMTFYYALSEVWFG